MNINLLSNNTFLNSINKTRIGNISNRNIKNHIAKDIFVKSTNNISFGSINDKKYSSLKQDITEYFTTAETLSVEEIRALVKKHLPDTGFDDIKNLPKGSNSSIYAGAYTAEPIAIYTAKNGKLQSETKPKTIYLNFHTPTQNVKESRIILLDRLLHEMSHVLQDEKGSDTRKEDFFNEYLSSLKNQQVAMANMQVANMIFNGLEKLLIETFKACSKTTGSLPKALKRDTDINSLFLKKMKITAEAQIQNYLSNSINLVNMKLGIINKKFISDFVILKAKNEKEAYQNALNSDKELLGINSKTDFDLRIEMYDNIIKVAESMKA